MQRFFSLLTASLLLAGAARAAAPETAPVVVTDTVQLTLPEAEQRFVQNNLALLAEQYNVTVAQAQAIQARLIDNPTISLEQNALNKAINRSHFEGRAPGEVVFQVQQLVSLAGRRRAAGRVAQQNALVEQFTLQDLLRNLRYQLRTAFYDMYFKQQTLGVYDKEIASFGHTVAVYQSQYDKGNIALKEVIRLKAFLFGLENERQALLTDISSEQADLHVLLHDGTGAYYKPVANATALRSLSLGSFTEQQLVDTALVARTDLMARQAAVEQQNQNLRLQRALVAPDLAVGYVYDKAGSYINNYHAFTLGVAVPIFNRNQGNLQAAQAQVEGSKIQLAQQQNIAQSDVHQAYQLVRRTDELFQGADRDTTPFERLIGGIEQSYAKRNLTIVEFLDFYESYKNNLVQLNSLRATRIRAFEQLNFAVGHTIFKTE